MATSTVPTVRTALHTVIAAQLVTDTITGVQVRKFPPMAADFTRDDFIWIETNPETNQDHLAFGGSREERATWTIVCFAPSSGFEDATAATAEARAFVLAGAVEDAIRTDPTLGAAGFHAEINSTDPNHGPDDEGFIGQVEVSVTVVTHI